MTRARSIPIWIPAGLAGAALVLALSHLIALQVGEVRIANWRVAAVAVGYDRKAEALLQTARPSTANLAEAERLSRLALNEFPYDTSSWIRIAYIDHLRDPTLSPTGLSALSRSYDLIAADPEFGAWRVHFALEHWANLPEHLKDSAREEAKAMSTDGRGRTKLKSALDAVKNPESAVMATLWRQRYVTRPSPVEHRTPGKAAPRAGY